VSEAAVLVQPQEESTSREIVVGEYVLDADTGEILRPYIAEGFSVKDQASFDWVMKKILDAETDMNARQMKHNFVLEQMKAEMKQAQSRVEWLKARFGPELEAYASQRIEEEQAKRPGKKVSKTIQSLFGKVSFRSVAGGVRVKDPSKALEWAKRFFPESIKVSEAFQISLVPDGVKGEIDLALTDETAFAEGQPGYQEGWNELAREAFEIKPDQEAFDIKAGGSK